MGNNKFEIVAKTLFGLEEVLAEELKTLGAESINVRNRAVTYIGDTELLYKSNLYLRTAIKILKPIHKFKLKNEDELYKGVRDIDWSEYIGVFDTLAIDASVNSNNFNHSKYVALKSKDAIVDQFRDKNGTRPSVDVEFPTLRINIHIQHDTCTVSLDSSGDALFKRGYRSDRNEAPLNEVLAAGMILLSGWDKKSTFVDPMCGSGTLLIEAAMIAYDIPPNLNRKEFGFEKWRDFDEDKWEEILTEARREKDVEFTGQILGSDISPTSKSMVRTNLLNARMSKLKIKVSKRELDEFTPPEGGGIVIFNPPYGERMREDDINDFYRMIGDNLKQKYADYNVWLITSNKQALKYLGLRPAVKKTLYNGSLECKFHKYEMYKGTRKVKNND